MNYIEHKITLDINATVSQVSLNTKKGDTARRLLIHLAENGYPYHIGEDCYAVFTALKPDGKVIFNNCTIDDCIISYAFTEQTVAVEGTMECEIILYAPGGIQLTSAGFVINVDDTVYDAESVVESQNEFNALADLISSAHTLVNEVEQKLEDGEFVGPQGPQGEQGPKGENGPQGIGIPGKSIIPITYNDTVNTNGGTISNIEQYYLASASVFPSSGDMVLTKQGDLLYAKRLQYVSYESTTLHYEYICNISGPSGARGVQGPKGDKGDKGDTGAQGPKGDTPVKGTDYWTEADKTEIVEEVQQMVGADWNAKEGEPGHVLNRTHWVSSGFNEIYNGTFEFSEHHVDILGVGKAVYVYSGIYLDDYPNTGNLPSYATIYIDGIEYVCPVARYGPSNLEGALSDYKVSVGDNEYIAFDTVYRGRNALIPYCTEGLIDKEFSIGFTDAIYHPIDERFIPHTVARTSDVGAYLPIVDSANEGQFLRVQGGQWQAVTIASAEGVSF